MEIVKGKPKKLKNVLQNIHKSLWKSQIATLYGSQSMNEEEKQQLKPLPGYSYFFFTEP